MMKVSANRNILLTLVGAALVAAAPGNPAPTSMSRATTQRNLPSVVAEASNRPVHGDTSAKAPLLPAFPGAEGWGASALNECRSKPVQVLMVTSTDSEGPGSLDQAVRDVRSGRFSFIIFRTGGRILAPANKNIRLGRGCVYIAGQTAPGDGVVIEGQGTAFWLRGYAHIGDVVMRYLRFRGSHGQTRNNLVIARGERIVLDHLSFSWTDNHLLLISRYGGMDWSAPISDVSVQNSIMSEVFAVHPTAFAAGSNNALKAAPSIDMRNISIQRNLMAHNSHRNPMLAADNALVINNVVYNWGLGVGMMNRRGTVDWVNNYAKPGPMTRAERGYVVNPYCDEFGGDFSVYAAGNIGPMSHSNLGDNWSTAGRQVACYHRSGPYPGADVPPKWRRDSPQPWADAPFPVRPLAATDTYREVLNDVGANAGLTCDGYWAPALDPVDMRVISEARNSSGTSRPPPNETSVGGWPTYATGAPCGDMDGDGLPDAWENRLFGCTTCADPAAIGRDGYLLMEHYLNGTSPR